MYQKNKKIIKLLLLSVLFCVVILVTNIILGVTLDIDQRFLAIFSGFAMMLWLIYFSIQVYLHYLHPEALFEKAFQDWGFEKKLLPTKEEYVGRYENANIKVDITKGRWQTNAYIYIDHKYPWLLAIGKRQPLQVVKKLGRNDYLPDYWDKFVVLNENQKSIEYLKNTSNRENIIYLINKYDVILYWEPERLKIHVPRLRNAGELREIIEKAVGLKINF